MSDVLARFHARHGGSRFPLLRLRDELRAQGFPAPERMASLGRELGLPPVALRAAISYYADLHEDAADRRVCQGTSCLLAAAAAPGQVSDTTNGCRKAYCLGYCHASPAFMDARSGSVYQGPCTADAREWTPQSEPLVRCHAREPIVTRRLLLGNHASLPAALEAGAYSAMKQALLSRPEEVVARVLDSGLRGRGGAAFPTGIKWKRCASMPAGHRHVVANGDEGDPGSFIDRVLMEQDPHAILEGMAIAAWAVGADSGVVFIRSEYPAALHAMTHAIEQAELAGYLGERILGMDFSFHVDVFPGMGSYVCGEESAMLNAIEGFRGEVRLRPPYPAESGLYGEPTVVDNVETLVSIPWIVQHGADGYSRLGTADSHGTKVFCLNNGFARPGVVEIEFGVSLRQVVEDFGGGCGPGAEFEALILGGPMGSILFPEQWDVPVCYAAMARRGIQLGHAGLVAVPKGSDWGQLLIHWLEFMQGESCGKCVPCRLGSREALKLARAADWLEAAGPLEELLELMECGSLCAFGQLMPGPVRTILWRLRDARFKAAGKDAP